MIIGWGGLHSVSWAAGDHCMYSLPQYCVKSHGLLGKRLLATFPVSVFNIVVSD